MGIFSSNTGGFMDEIRCDEQEYLIWKWHPKGARPGDNLRENAIRWGSSLRIRDGSVAAFVYKQGDGTMQDFIEGPFDQIIKTANFPVLASLVGLAYDGGTPFQAEVYFINLARVIQTKFAVPFFDVYDPRFLDFGVPVAVRGTLTFKISDYREFVKLHRLDSFDLKTFEAQVKDAITRYVKGAVTNAPADFGIPIVQIERRIAQVNELVLPLAQQRLKENFGVDVSGVDIAAIELDKTSEGYQQLKAVTLDASMQTVQAQTTINIKNLEDQQRINAQNMEETLRVQREEAQYAQRKTTQSQNFAAYQTEAQTAVGIAGAEALGQMGAGGALDLGSSDIGNAGGDGMNPAAMMAGMAMGGAIGQGMASMIGNTMNGIGQQPTPASPPPVPSALYHVAAGGQATGPYDLPTLRRMAEAGLLSPDSLVWKEGMAAWEKASAVPETAQAFSTAAPPPLPNDAAPRNQQPSDSQTN